MKKGALSIHTDNIFPIIKKFLYSNQEVFLRELVSNAVDATQKLVALSSIGEFNGELGDITIEILLDEDARTLTIRDKGVGMTAEEVEQYINQIAFSSAEEFLARYQDAGAQIIGHFGLGFYSAFMVAGQVEIRTRSYKPDAVAQRWTCDGTTEFTLEDAEKDFRGTDVILHILPEHDEYLKSYRLSEILNKYCKFLPVEIEFEGTVINETQPLWKKKPAELSSEDYTEFYSKLYPYSEAPLFWIHLNVDYPFTLTGILYFPRLRPNMDLQKNKIQLYSNQVFITDAVEDVVPDYLTLLHGVIDSPDIPLNVSRSYLQTDANVRKISSHISKKVADKLNELFNENRDDFNSKWEYIGVFVKYGMIKDHQFYDRARKFCLLYNTDNEFYTLDEYREKIQVRQTDKDNNVVILYATDVQGQHTFIDAAKKQGYDVIIMDGVIDLNFIQFIEHKLEKVSIVRVDSDTVDKLIDKGVEKASLLNEEEEKIIVDLFNAQINSPFVTVTCRPLADDMLPVAIVKPEHTRRVTDMYKNGMLGAQTMPESYRFVVNSAHPLAKKILLQPEGPARTELAAHAYQLALLSQNMLSGQALTNFIERNVELMQQTR